MNESSIVEPVVSEPSADYQRYCPGEAHIHISEAVCVGRRRANFRKCPGCQFNDDERGTASFAATVIRPRPVPVSPVDQQGLLEKVFKAYDVRAIYPNPLNEEIAWRIGNASAQFLRTVLSGYDRSDPRLNTLLTGRDMRSSSPSLHAALMEGAAAVGAPVIDLGLIDTPQLYFAANHLACCGGVQTTASHNPADYNGFKICGQKGKPIGADSGLKEIQRIAQAIARHKVTDLSNISRVDLSRPYREFLRKFLHEPRSLKIAVDASNGMAGRLFPIVFDDLSALEITPLNFEHEGVFAHPPNPLVPANLDQLRSTVRDSGADLGVCFDGDADRCVLVDDQAEIVPGDLLTALLAADMLRNQRGAIVIYDLRSSRIVPETIRAAGGVPRRERVGHVFMKRAMNDSGAIFGGELSGHFYFRDFFGCDSAMLAFIAVLNLLTRTGQPLSALLAPLRKYAASGEQNFENDDLLGVLRALRDRYRDAQIDELDGLTVQYPDWWFNVRSSNTEPLVRLNLEASGPEMLNRRLSELAPLLGRPVAH